jgi:hypothetical protein
MIQVGMTVKCPHCDYEGRVASVEAHISGKSDEVHRGHVGQTFRDSLPQLGNDTEPEELEELEQPSSFGSVSPGLALIAATVLLAVVVITSTSPSAPESEEPDGATGWE